ncbi:hypothetical protein D3C78_1193750 [compost metagenome]
MAAGDALDHRAGQVLLQIGIKCAGDVVLQMDAGAVAGIVEGEAAVEDHQVGVLQAGSQMLRAEQVGEGHGRAPVSCRDRLAS